MSGEPSLPFRILFVGPSTLSWISMMDGPRSDLALPRALEGHLLARGYAAEVRSVALLGQPTHRMFHTWERDIVQWSPDVVVCEAGRYETIHVFLPSWFERTSNRLDHVPGPIRDRFRKWVVRAAWKLLVRLQAALDRPGRFPLRRRIARTAWRVGRYITLTRRIQTPGFLVLEAKTPAPRARKWFPGMAGRVALLNELLQEVVDSFDSPDVGYLPITPIAESMYGDDLMAHTPDGIHFTPALHDAIASAVADWIEKWAVDHPHLGRRL